MLPPLLLRASLRHFLHHRVQTLLAVIGVAVGVAAWVSVQTAARGAQHAFDVSAAQAFGEASHQLLPLGDSLPDTLYVRLRTELGLPRAAPVLGGRVRVVVGADAVDVDLLGIDPLAEAGLRPAGAAAADAGLALLALVGDAELVLLSDALAGRLDVAAGDVLALRRPDGDRRLRVADVVPAGALPLGEHTLLVDIAAAQRVLDRRGRLSRVDLLLDDAQAERVAAWLPDGVELVPTAAHGRAVAGMTRAYRINLQALSLLTLLVGTLLVYGTLTHLVEERRLLFQRFGALGLAAGAVRRLVLAEAVALGLVGGVFGAAVGSVLARALVGLMAGSISDLYFRVEVRSLAVDPWVVGAGVLLGVAASLAGAAVPARDATVWRHTPTGRGRWTPVASVPAAAAAALLFVFSDTLVPAFAALFLVAFAGALLVPPVVRALCALLLACTPLRHGLLARMTLRATAASVPRTGVALAGLVLAVAAVVAMDTMITNFRTSVADWLDEAVPGDQVIGLDSAVYPDAQGSPLAELWPAVAALPEVDAVSAVRTRRLREGAGTLLLRAIDVDRQPPRLVAGGAGDVFIAGDGVLVSEPLARRRGLAVGDPLALTLPERTVRLPVLGVVRDYVSDQGVVLMSLPAYRQLTGDTALSSLTVHAAPGVSSEALADALRPLLAGWQGLVPTAAADVRERTLAVFDRTFTVTRVLRVLAAGVAFMGILGTLLAVMLARAGQQRALRSVGLPASTLRGLAVLETAVLGVATALVALPLGLVLSWLLVFVINRRAFGWGMQFEPLPGPLLAGAALAVLTAITAGLAASLARLHVERQGKAA